MKRMSRTSIGFGFGAIAVLSATGAIANTSVPITYINFAGAGGNSSERYGTFVVPDKDTTESAYGGALTRYDVHLAKMVEITADQWCAPRPNFQGVYWNYQADRGNIFMGQVYISCRMAQQAVRTYGLGRPERTLIHHRGQGPEVVNIPVLDVNGPKIPQFQRWVQRLQMRCLDRLCPGDVTGERF